jgi:hypothetical protein
MIAGSVGKAPLQHYDQPMPADTNQTTSKRHRHGEACERLQPNWHCSLVAPTPQLAHDVLQHKLCVVCDAHSGLG